MPQAFALWSTVAAASGPELFSAIIGWLITALAVSLGAPFWFDLLNKFMVIRSTVKPHEKSPEEASEDRQPRGATAPRGDDTHGPGNPPAARGRTGKPTTGDLKLSLPKRPALPLP